MTLRKSLVYSLGTHAAILIAFLIAALFSLNEPSPAAQTLRIRLRASMSAGSRAVPRFTGAAPADSIRERRQPAGISSISDSSAVSSPEAPAPVTRYTEVLDNIPVSRLQTAPPAALPEVDPLGGIDVPAAAPQQAQNRADGADSRARNWSLDWADGNTRAVLSFPSVSFEKFPDSNERLLETSLEILVSPQGNVVSAEVIPPGSGNAGVDRYLNSLALQLVMEPADPEKGEQKALLRLVFAEGGGG